MSSSWKISHSRFLIGLFFSKAMWGGRHGQFFFFFVVVIWSTNRRGWVGTSGLHGTDRQTSGCDLELVCNEAVLSTGRGPDIHIINRTILLLLLFCDMDKPLPFEGFWFWLRFFVSSGVSLFPLVAEDTAAAVMRIQLEGDTPFVKQWSNSTASGGGGKFAAYCFELHLTRGAQ